MCSELLNLLYDFDRTSLSLFIFNFLMFVFYNSNKDIFIESQSNMYNVLCRYLSLMVKFIKEKSSHFYNYVLNYFFSKNTQLILKIAYNMTKTKVVRTYMEYKNKLFNPPLLFDCISEQVYCVSFYLNGETYKIPVIVNRYSFNKKQQPLMILNKNEEDVTQKISQYMGPNNDFYGMVLKPKYLNEQNLNFMMEDGSEINVLENDMMVL